MLLPLIPSRELVVVARMLITSGESIPSRELILIPSTLVAPRESVPSALVPSPATAAVHVGPGVLVVWVSAAHVDVLVVRIHTSLQIGLICHESESDTDSQILIQVSPRGVLDRQLGLVECDFACFTLCYVLHRLL